MATASGESSADSLTSTEYHSQTVYRESLAPLAATEYRGQTSFFGDEPPLHTWIGVLVVLGFGFLFTIIAASAVKLIQSFGTRGELTSEYFTYVRRNLINRSRPAVLGLIYVFAYSQDRRSYDKDRTHGVSNRLPVDLGRDSPPVV
jgi:hypothetical protein